MSNPFEEAIRGVRRAVTEAIDVSDLLLADLVDKRVITPGQHDQILVRSFTVFIVYRWGTLFVCTTSATCLVINLLPCDAERGISVAGRCP